MVIFDAGGVGGVRVRGVPARLCGRDPALAARDDAFVRGAERGGGVDGGLGGTYADGVGSAMSLSITDFATKGDLGGDNRTLHGPG